MEKISFTIVGEDRPADFYVLEQTRIGGFSYLLVTDREEGDSDAWILRDLSADGEEEAVYEIVEDEEELQAVAGVFEQMLDDVEIE
ncbi:MAG: DUF1292 domain-containing protein [Lachnospiraceae bacterium]|nr:DUF1292 domain-containing protein [Lachnospiraceae bacterium]